MKRSPWLKEVLKAGRPFHFRRQNPLKHNLINIGASSVLWSLIVGTILLTQHIEWYLVPFLGIFLGSFFFGHFVLIIHECSHGMFLVHKNPDRHSSLNHRIGKIASIPFFTAYDRHWKEGHQIHHTDPCSSHDPQNPDPLDGKRLYDQLLRLCFIPFWFLMLNPSRKYDQSAIRLTKGILFWSVLLTVLQASLKTALLLYVSFVVLSALNLLKIAQEHGSGLAKEEFAILRSRTYFYPFQFLFSPFNINYHFEHHANALIPWYLLPAYHKIATSIVPKELQSYYFHKTYLLQLSGKKECPPISLLQAHSSKQNTVQN